MAEHVALLLKSLKLPTFVRHYRTLLDEQADWTVNAKLKLPKSAKVKFPTCG